MRKPQSETKAPDLDHPRATLESTSPQALLDVAFYRMQENSTLGLCKIYYGMLNGETKRVEREGLK